MKVEDLKPGLVIYHKVFGRGVVEGVAHSVERRGFGSAVRLRFDRYGVKEMLLDFCLPKMRRAPGQKPLAKPAKNPRKTLRETKSGVKPYIAVCPHCGKLLM